MKKSFLFLAAIALVFAACQPKYDVEDKTVATFEESAISPAAPESALAFENDTVALMQSGIFQIQQTVSWGGSYVTGGVVTNITDTEFKSYADAYKSAAGGAKAGKNYLVWYCDAYGNDAIRLETAATVPGMFVCNNVYALSSMKDGDEYAGDPFDENDWFMLTITGTLEGKTAGTVEFYLAKGKNIVTDWTYVDLSSLGKVDELTFTLTGSRTGDWGLNTPAYFCIDNLGAKK